MDNPIGVFDSGVGGLTVLDYMLHQLPQENMIYIGDGYTDVPCMALVKEKGGTAISIYQPNSKEKSIKLIEEDRVNYACKSDFRSGSQLENLLKLILESIALKEKLIARESKKILQK